MAKKQILIPRVSQERPKSWCTGAIGSIPHWADLSDTSDFEWTPAAPFKLPDGRLDLFRMQRGRSAAYAIMTVGSPGDFRSAVQYSMFLTDLEDVLAHEGIVGGKWHAPGGIAVPIKRGANFGIRRATDDELREWIRSSKKLQGIADALKVSSESAIGPVEPNPCSEVMESAPATVTFPIDSLGVTCAALLRSEDFPQGCTFPTCPCSDERICFAKKAGEPC